MDEIRTTYAQRMFRNGFGVHHNDEFGWHWYNPSDNRVVSVTDNDLQQVEILLALVHVDGLIHGE